jgi:hypothetical protein
VKKGTKYGLLVAIPVVVFGVARVYGAYQNEHRRALAIEAQFTKWANELDCSWKWSLYKHSVGEMASLEQLKQVDKKSAMELENDLKSSASYTTIEPTCRLEDDDPLMPQRLNVKAMQAIAGVAHQYAFDRGLQTQHILHNTWAAVTGTNLETTDEEVARLAK